MNVKIEKLDHYGRGITKINNKICFVENALPNEIVKIEVIKETKKYFLAKVIDFIEKSPSRIIEKCPYYNICNGCNLEHLSYSKENEFKRRKVQEILVKFAKINPKLVTETIYSLEYKYRNKVTLHGNDKCLGYYKKDSKSLLNIEKCCLLDSKINEIINLIQSQENKIKELLIRVSNDSKMLMLKINGEFENVNDLIGKVDVLIYNNKLLTTNKKIITQIGNKKYYLSIDSFFQVNKNLTVELYDKVKQLVKEEKPDKLLDLYTGTGTIGIYVSEYAKEIIAVDSSESNILDANQNKELNNISNIKFINDKVENVIDTFSNIDMIIVDPPRAGLDKKTINSIEKINPKKIIYVSCDPVTFARDVNLLNNYEVKEVVPVNMFPRTYHVECVSLLQKKTI